MTGAAFQTPAGDSARWRPDLDRLPRDRPELLQPDVPTALDGVATMLDRTGPAAVTNPDRIKRRLEDAVAIGTGGG
jgi:hypothetical protein